MCRLSHAPRQWRSRSPHTTARAAVALATSRTYDPILAVLAPAAALAVNAPPPEPIRRQSWDPQQARGLSFAALGAAVGVSPAVVHAYEHSA
jgi:hypothetical protein